MSKRTQFVLSFLMMGVLCYVVGWTTRKHVDDRYYHEHPVARTCFKTPAGNCLAQGLDGVPWTADEFYKCVGGNTDPSCEHFRESASVPEVRMRITGCTACIVEGNVFRAPVDGDMGEP